MNFTTALTRELHGWQDETTWLAPDTVGEMLEAAATAADDLTDLKELLKEATMLTLNLGLDNEKLYAGCDITEVGGRLTLATPAAEAANVVGRNAQALVDATHTYDRRVVTLTGAMAVWAYLVVFHVVLHQFGEVWYDDGKGNRVLIAKH